MARPIPSADAREGAHEAADRPVAVFDCCFFRGRRVESAEHLRTIAAGGELAEVNGAFVVSWVDAEGTVHLARDAIGERSLFYAAAGARFVFAPSLGELLRFGLRRTLNRRAIASYLTYAYIPGRETLIEGVYKVLPGEVVSWRNGSIESRFYWSLPPERESGDEEEELRRDLRSVLEDAVRRRLPRGEPIAASLSGGLDSSLVVALARKLHDAPVSTWSISFGEGYANELPFSSMVATHCATDHHVVELSPATILRHFDETIRLLNDPIGDPLTVPNAVLFREMSARARVAVNGEGGDPCFGGPKNLPMLLSELFDSASTREGSYLRAHQKCYDDLSSILEGETYAADLEAEVRGSFDDPRWRRFVTKLMAINLTFKGAGHILPKVMALSEAAGVVARSPLFDRDVVELAFAIPPQLKLRGSIEKYLLKRAVADLLPAAILDRPKSGMLVPVEAWFKGPLLPLARERLLDGLTPYGLFRRRYLEDLLRGTLGGLRPRRGTKIWLLVTLESWLRQHRCEV